MHVEPSDRLSGFKVVSDQFWVIRSLNGKNPGWKPGF